jgi:pre-mRNA-splicing factor CDC5/CEF1
LNTALNNADFSSVVPTPNVVATPNTVLATPFRSQRSDASPAPFNTPGSVRPQNATAAQTPIRDKLNINPEEAIEASETPIVQKQVGNLNTSK